MQIKTNTIKLQQLPSGDFLNIKTYKILGKGTKKVYIQANIHGPELTGILVAKKLLKYLQGVQMNFKEIIIVPSCNPIGLNHQFLGQQTGYINHLTGINWNRIYKNLAKGIEIAQGKKISVQNFTKLLLQNIKKQKNTETDLESKLALILQELALDADVVIDLHTAWGVAPHYIYCYKDQFEYAKKFNVENIVFLEEKGFAGVFDESNLYPYFSNKENMVDFKLPKRVFTLELGSDCSLDEKNIEDSFEKVLGYLKYEESGKSPKEKTAFSVCELKDFIYYHAPVGGLIVWKKNQNDFLKKGEVFCEIYQVQSEEVYEVKALEAGKLIIKFRSHSVHQGQRIAKIMTNIQK